MLISAEEEIQCLIIYTELAKISGKWSLDHNSQSFILIINEPVHEKTNNLGSRVRHKPGCTVTEDG